MAAPASRPEVASLWSQTAGAAPRFAALDRDVKFDVAIIGGGYTGLNAARYLARKGLNPVVLEANRIGWGASGRNGGVVSGKFRISFADIDARHGIETARRMRDLGDEAVDHVGTLVADYDIVDADYSVSGSLRCAHNEVSFAKLRNEAAWLREALDDRSIHIVDAEGMRRETGSGAFVGGLLSEKGGIIQPLNFVRGIASGLDREGVSIFEESPVERMREDNGGLLLETPAGTVRARQAVVATNAYSDLTASTAAFGRTLIPFRSAMIATEPLSGAAAALLPSGRSYSETRRMMRWFRKAGDRFLFGGRGAFGREDSDAAFAALHKAMVAQFPELSAVRVTHRWSGLVGLTLDSLPHVGRLDGKVSYALGYNGTGVAMSTLMGKYLADIVTGEEPDIGLLSSSTLKSIPFYSIREPAVRIVAGWYQFLDAIGR